MTSFQHLGDIVRSRAIERDPVSEKKKAVWIVFLHGALLGSRTDLLKK